MKTLSYTEARQANTICPFCLEEVRDVDMTTHYNDQGTRAACWSDSHQALLPTISFPNLYDGDPARIKLARDRDGDLWLIVKRETTFGFWHYELVPTTWDEAIDLLEIGVEAEKQAILHADGIMRYWLLQQQRVRELAEYFQKKSE